MLDYGGSWESEIYSYSDAGNRNGWYFGALGGQDNGQRDWRTHNEFRTAVLAKSLTCEVIIDAHRKRRFYATENKDLYLIFDAAATHWTQVGTRGPHLWHDGPG